MSRGSSPSSRSFGPVRGTAPGTGRPPIGLVTVTDGFRRLRRSPIPFWVMTGVVALVGARAIRTAGVERATPFGPLRETVVVTRSIESGTALTARDVRIEKIPGQFVPIRPAATVGAVLGRAVRVDLAPGQAVDIDDLTPKPASPLAVLAGPNRVVVAIGTTAESLPLRVGDRVAVMMTVDGASTATTVTRNAVVCERNDRRVSISVSDRDAERVTGAMSAGIITLALLGA
jgi:Flp pilus assembly protein CpaB